MSEYEMAGSSRRLLYEQVYDMLRDGIMQGRWKEHEKLPSVRATAERMNVHRLTVFKAYQRLKDDRFVYVKDKSGYFVNPAGGTEEAWAYSAVPANANRSRLSEIHLYPAEYRMAEALIDPNLLPNLFLSEYVKRVFDLYPKAMGMYANVQGDLELREALSRYFNDTCGFEITAEQLMITSGAQQAIDMATRALTRPGDTVIVERPTYSAALDTFRQCGLRMESIDITPDGYDLDRLERLMQRTKPRLFYMNPTFHNPTGYTVPSRQRKQLVELAERYRCVLLEDDAFYELYFRDPPPRPIFGYDADGYTVYIRSFSKYIAPGLRIAAVAARPSVMREFVPVKSLLDNGSPLLNQKIFLHYFFSNRLQEHIAKLRIAVQLRKEKMESLLASSGWSWTSPAGGLNVWVRVPEAIPTERLLELCLAQSVSIVPGSICDPAGSMDDWIRLSYAYMSETKIEEGMRRLLGIAERLSREYEVER